MKTQVTDPTKLMREALENLGTSKSPVLTSEFVLAECADVKDEMNRLALSTMNKADVDKAIKAYNAEWIDPELKQINKTIDMTRQRDIALLNNRYDHAIQLLDRITIGGAVMFGVVVFLIAFIEYIR
tara:strand:+ start:505 stop:885 length:381 start_codon:yes stop_codon:yes gene_type:complete